jgi:hypothetical protein
MNELYRHRNKILTKCFVLTSLLMPLGCSKSTEEIHRLYLDIYGNCEESMQVSLDKKNSV